MLELVSVSGLASISVGVVYYVSLFGVFGLKVRLQLVFGISRLRLKYFQWSSGHESLVLVIIFNDVLAW